MTNKWEDKYGTVYETAHENKCETKYKDHCEDPKMKTNVIYSVKLTIIQLLKKNDI
jgi:hypothetical protein